MPLSPSEQTMWRDPGALSRADSADSETAINDKYLRGEGRIVIETNREKLPGFVEALKGPDYMDLRPFYQRRPRWTSERQSLLIESFIMNVPVPPIFLYERDYNKYEVMDGQQRITAIRDFYQSRFALTGLVLWPELNGRYYHNLPATVKAGIDRRSISSIVLLKESAPDDEDALLLRQLVFERLNTGGVRLESQEIRNALYLGPFNRLLLELSRDSRFRHAWNLPAFEGEDAELRNEKLLKSPLFAKMEDTELVLRFFALRHSSHYRGGMDGFLDRYMIRAASFGPEDIAYLRKLFEDTIELVKLLYDDHMFRPFDVEKTKWTSRAQRAFYDCVMVGISEFADRKSDLERLREEIQSQTKMLFLNHPKGTFTGRGNTKADIEQRIGLYRSMIQSVLAA